MRSTSTDKMESCSMGRSSLALHHLKRHLVLSWYSQTISLYIQAHVSGDYMNSEMQAFCTFFSLKTKVLSNLQTIMALAIAIL